MHQDIQHRLRSGAARRSFIRHMAPLACGLLALAGAAAPCVAAEIDVVGTGTFKPLPPDRVAALPQGVVFSKADLSSGIWSFLVRYEDNTPDSNPDPYVGSFVGAIRAVQLTVGATTIALPPENAELVVSDGGLGFPDRESIRVQTESPTPFGVMRFSWTQINQAPHRGDLRGAPGSLPSDALPAPSTLANLATSSRFDKFAALELSASQNAKPFLYVSSSQFSVVARSATTK